MDDVDMGSRRPPHPRRDLELLCPHYHVQVRFGCQCTEMGYKVGPRFTQPRAHIIAHIFTAKGPLFLDRFIVITFSRFGNILLNTDNDFVIYVTATTFSQRWDHSIRSTCGGSAT